MLPTETLEKKIDLIQLKQSLYFNSLTNKTQHLPKPSAMLLYNNTYHKLAYR